MYKIKSYIMENYKEKVNYGTEKEPLWRDRLFVSRATYGYFLYDRKNKKSLISKKSLETCNSGKELLLKGKEEEFLTFLEEIKDEVVVEPKILVFKEKHGDKYYYANTYEQLKKVSLEVLAERLSYWYITKWGIPTELDYSFEDIDKLPETFRHDAKLKLKENKKRIKEATDNNRIYEAAVRAVDEQNGDLAWTIIQNRTEYEYEEFEFVEPIDL